MAVLEGIAQDTKQKIEQLGNVEIVLGIPTYNNANTIKPVIHVIQAALKTYFTSTKSVILHSDGGSNDGTIERVLEIPSDTVPIVQAPYSVSPAQKLTMPYLGVPGKSSAYRTLFELAAQLGARACVIVDCDVTGLRPVLIQRLLPLVLDRQFDLAAPHYFRHKFEGTVTSSILYPLTRALYGRRVRQPISGDLCVSAKLIQHCLAQDVWNNETLRSAIDIWIATQAICRGFQVCEAFVGVKTRGLQDRTADLSAMMSPILGATFLEMERTLTIWQRVRGSQAVSIFGDQAQEDVEPIAPDAKRMIDSFRIGQQNLQEIWSLVLPPVTLVELKKLARRSDQEFRLQDAVWARTIYDFALAYRLRTISRDHLLQALTPIYWAWLASFITEMQDASHAEAEARIEQLCLQYEAEKPYLISRWRWPDRFNP